jgi:hypothetical protein
MPAETLLPTEAESAGHGATPELPKPKTPKEWAEQRGNNADALSQYARESRDAAAARA